MNILSVYWSICSGASVLRDGCVVSAAHEERFSRAKNDDAYPRRAIDACMEDAGLRVEDLDGIAIASHYQDYFHQLTRPGRWTTSNYVEEQHNYWKPVLLQGRQVRYEEVMAHLVDRSQYPEWYWSDTTRTNLTFPADRKSITARHLGVAEEKIRTIEHHRAHAFYAYHASPFRDRKVLAFTVDGSGDNLNATIGVFDERGTYERLFSTNQCFIARYYRYMTLLLGMKPNEHEYKLMGLAPYGREQHAKKPLDLFRSTLYVEGLEFKWRTKPSDSYFWFRERLEGERFDNIAWALQTWVEETLCQWVGNAIRQFGIADIVLAGGVAMNIKAMGKIAELPAVREIFVPGSADDGSLAIGAGLCLDHDLTGNAPSRGQGGGQPRVPNLFLGPAASVLAEDAAVGGVDTDRYEVIRQFDNDLIVARLLQGDVIGRCSGRMEFGQRALGNRSLLADPCNPYVKEKLNSVIKSRDFWMPFAPIVLDSYQKKYLRSPLCASEYMTLAFQTTDEGFNAMRAACHPADRTARAQVLTRDANPVLYDLMTAFAAQTGRGALLNTSFNIHGEPIVNSPADAVDVLKRTGLDGLLLERHLVLRRQ